MTRLATWNVNSLTARLPRVTAWLAEQAPDVLFLQETKQSDDKFPSTVFSELGYESAHHGDGRWNGVALLSRVGLTDVARGFANGADEHGSRIVSANCGGMRVHSVYVPNGRSLDNEFYAFKLEWLANLRAHLDGTVAQGDAVVVAGDFNVAPDDEDVWDPEQFVGLTHVSEPERAALAEVQAWGLHDVFRRFNPPGVFSWWDYRGGDFHLGRGVRMDLLLVSSSVAERATGSFVDRNARKGEKPSDHAPVVLDLADD
jgi:exodeoxyribonuclease III